MWAKMPVRMCVTHVESWGWRIQSRAYDKMSVLQQRLLLCNKWSISVQDIFPIAKQFSALCLRSKQKMASYSWVTRRVLLTLMLAGCIRCVVGATYVYMYVHILTLCCSCSGVCSNSRQQPRRRRRPQRPQLQPPPDQSAAAAAGPTDLSIKLVKQ